MGATVTQDFHAKKQTARATNVDAASRVEYLANELRLMVDWLDDFPMRKPSFGDMRMIANRIERLHNASIGVTHEPDQ